MRRLRIAIALVLANLPTVGAAQTPLAFLLDDAPNAASRASASTQADATTLLIWRRSKPADLVGSDHTAKSGFARFLAPATLRIEANSGYPSDRNNGSLWGGKGLNTQLQAGLEFRSKHFSAAVIPEVNHQQNGEFKTRAPSSSTHDPLSNPFYGTIDLPQRFGTESYTSIAPGQSYVRADVGPFGAGVSTENLWWGPGLRESIVLSNTAPGFPHAFAETDRPVHIGIGLLGASFFWGRQSESEYFDTIQANDHRLFTGAAFTFQPDGARNLTLGITRLFTVAWDSLSGRSLIPFFAPVLKEQLATPGNPKGNNSDDQRLSVFAHYRLPDPGFEVYGEFGREDHSWDLRDLVGEPDHSAAYLVGFQRIATLSPTKSVRVQGEWLNLQSLRANSPDRTTPVYYTHRPQGHTNLGQMLGAGIGPGAESQYLSVDVLNAEHSLGGFLERVRRNETSGPAIASRKAWPPKHDVEVTLGARASRHVNVLDVSAQLSASRRLQRDFIEDETNIRFVLQSTWRP
jgi:hypothetical protein